MCATNRKRNAPTELLEVIEKMIVDIEQNSDFSPMTLFKGYIFSIIFYTVFGLIVAAFTKKEKPEFTEE